jgi:ABC-type transport system involved in multi-copper enzyme maturation permease subunit
MNPLLEVWLVAARDLRKNVRSVKGLVMLGISLLGAFVSTLKLPKFEDAIGNISQLDAVSLHEVKARFFGTMYGDEATGKTLADAPLKLVFLFYIAVWLAPLLVMILGFDGISSDLQYRSVRYWTIRCRRPSYYAGKLLALWAIVGLLTFVMQLMIWVVTISNGEAPSGETIEWGLRFWATSLPITGAWCGVAVLVSSLAKTPMLSLLGTVASFLMLFILGLVFGRGRDVEAMKYLYPNNFDGWIMSANHAHMMEGLGACLVYIVGTYALGAYILTTRDV